MNDKIKYKTFSFDFDSIMKFCHSLDTTIKQLDYLDWIQKEYKNSGSPLKKVEKKYRERRRSYVDMIDDHYPVSERTVITDPFINKIKAEIEFLEKRKEREAEVESRTIAGNQEDKKNRSQQARQPKFDKQIYGNFEVWNYSLENEFKDLPAISVLKTLPKQTLESLLPIIDNRLDRIDEKLFGLPDIENEEYFIQKYLLEDVNPDDWDLQIKDVKNQWQDLREQLPKAKEKLNQYRNKVQEKLEMAKKTEKNGNNKNGLPDYCTMFETLVLACFNIPLLRNQVKSIEKYYKDLEDSGEYVPVYAEQNFREGYFNYIQNELDEILMKDTFNGIMDYDSILNPLNDDQVKSIIHRFEDIYNNHKVKDGELYLSFFSKIRNNGTDIIRVFEQAIISLRKHYKDNSVETAIQQINKKSELEVRKANELKLAENFDKVRQDYRLKLNDLNESDKLIFLHKEITEIEQNRLGNPDDFDGLQKVLRYDNEDFELVMVKYEPVLKFLQLEINKIETVMKLQDQKSIEQINEINQEQEPETEIQKFKKKIENIIFSHRKLTTFPAEN